MPIYKVNNKYIVKVSINGKQILRRKYLGKDIFTKEIALKCEKDLLIKFSEAKEDYIINDLTNLYIDYLYKKYKDTTATGYLYSFFKHIYPLFVDHKISDITRMYIVFVNEEINKVPSASIKKIISIGKSYLEFLTNYGLSNYSNLLFVYKRNNLKKKVKKYYTLEEFNQFYNIISDTRDKLMFKLLFYYGLRIGELRGLKVSDFKKDRLTIEREIQNKNSEHKQKVFAPKSEASVRMYPYVNDIYDLFLKVKKDYNLYTNDFIFFSEFKDSLVIGENTIKRKIINYANLSAVGKILTPHEFRHSCATYLINQNVDVKLIANWLGHTTSQITEKVYAHILPLKKDIVAKAFEDK